MRDRLDLVAMARQIAAEVRRLRKAHGWTQQQLADAIQKHRSTVIEIEKGQRDHDHSTIQAVADALGVVIGEITGAQTELRGLSAEAMKIARLYDSMDVEDRAAVKRIFQRFASGPTSS